MANNTTLSYIGMQIPYLNNTLKAQDTMSYYYDYMNYINRKSMKLKRHNYSRITYPGMRMNDSGVISKPMNDIMRLL